MAKQETSAVERRLTPKFVRVFKHIKSCPACRPKQVQCKTVACGRLPRRVKVDSRFGAARLGARA